MSKWENRSVAETNNGFADEIFVSNKNTLVCYCFFRRVFAGSSYVRAFFSNSLPLVNVFIFQFVPLQKETAILKHQFRSLARQTVLGHYLSTFIIRWFWKGFGLTVSFAKMKTIWGLWEHKIFSIQSTHFIFFWSVFNDSSKVKWHFSLLRRTRPKS